MTTLHDKYIALPVDDMKWGYIHLNFPNNTFNAMQCWIAQHFEEISTLEEIVKYGMVAGFGSLIYYKDTVEFYDRFKNEIWDLLYELGGDYAMNPLELIASFNGAKDVGSDEQFKNLLCWIAVEQTAQMFLNDIEDNKEI